MTSTTRKPPLTSLTGEVSISVWGWNLIGIVCGREQTINNDDMVYYSRRPVLEVKVLITTTFTHEFLIIKKKGVL